MLMRSRVVAQVYLTEIVFCGTVLLFGWIRSAVTSVLWRCRG